MRTEYSYTLTPDEFARAVLHRNRRIPYPLPLKWLVQGATMAMFAALGFLFVHGARSASPGSSPVSIAAGAIVLLWLAAYGLQQIALRRACRDATYLAGSERRLAVKDSGIREVGSVVDSFHPWSAFRGVEESDGLVYLMLDGLHFHAIPDSAFANAEERRAFVESARQRIAAAQAGPHGFPSSMPAPAVPAAKAESLPAIRAGRRVGDAFRLAFFRSAPASRMEGTWKHIFAFALATLALPVAIALVRVGWNGEWSWHVLPFAVFHVPLVLVAAIAAAHALARPADVPRLFLAGLMIAFAVDVVASALQLGAMAVPSFARGMGRLDFVWSAWLASALAVYACRSGAPALRRVLAATCCIVLVGLPLGTIYRERSPWHAPYGDDEGVANSTWGIAAEDAFYRQPQILARELDAVKPGRPGAVDVFFVGMAGHGYQDVFMREVDSVARLFRGRFGAEGRAVRLVNNPKSLFDTPIATKTSLAAALKKIASVMDREEDVLVLFMTSHGSESHRFSLDMFPMQLHEVDPKTLRRLLDESGIRNRVVVVSACYSGGFVEALKDDHTLVITSSAPDRKSFGCSNEAEWTYFGKAYFDEALRTSHSFVRAFELAKPAIEQREKKDEYTPSDPQMSLGAKIAPRLEELERQLRSGVQTTGAGATAVAAGFDGKVERYVSAIMGATDMRLALEICRSAMRESAPEKWLEQDPAAFNGLDKSSKYWPSLAAAWDSFSEDLCARANDPAVLQAIVTDQTRAQLKEGDVDAFLRFTAGEDGRRWLAASRLAERRQMEALAKFQDHLTKDGHRRFREEQARIFAEFEKDNKAAR